MDSRAQISIELIVIMAALVVVAFLLVSKFYSTSKVATQEIDKKTKGIIDTFKDFENL